MFYVYVLENEDRELYFGYTNNLKRRVKEHSENKVFSTKDKQYSLIYYEAYKSKTDATTREQRLKNYGQAWAQVKRRIFNSRRHES